MTRAEAIEILKDDVMCQRGWINQLSGMTKEIAEGRIKAHELAISSLETDEAYQLEYEKPTTKNDLGVDAISRAEAQTEIEMNASRYTIAKERGGMGQVEWSDQLIKVSDAVDIIRHLPSVTPQEPKIGHWIDCDNSEDYSADGYDCSVCGVNTEYATSYCPNCGARMVEPQESEDKEFHCGVEESGFHAYNCNDCPNKCEEWHQWDKEMKND